MTRTRAGCAINRLIMPLAFALAMGPTPWSTPCAAETAKPHIIFIMADDK